MAVSSPSGTRNTAANPGNKPPRWRPFWRLVWRIAVTAILGAIGAAAGFYTEALLSNLPSIPQQMRDAPGVVRIVVIAIVAIVIALVIASYFWGKKADEDEEDTISPKLDALTQSDEAIKKDTTAILEQGEQTYQQVTTIAALLTSEALAIPATVMASSLPRGEADWP